MASFIVVSCGLERFSLETCNAKIAIAWVRCTPMTIVDLFGMKIRHFTGSTRALGRLLEKKLKMMTKIRKSRYVWPHKGIPMARERHATRERRLAIDY